MHPVAAGKEPPKKPERPQNPGSQVVGDPSSKPGLPITPSDATHPASGSMPEGTTPPSQSPTKNLPPMQSVKSSSKPLLAQMPQKLKLPPSPFAEAVRSPTHGAKSPSRGVQSPTQDPQSPTKRPQSPQSGVHSPTRGLQSPPEGLHSSPRGPQAPHRGVQSPIRTPQSPNRGVQSPTRRLQSPPRDPKSPQKEPQALPGSFSNPSALMPDLPHSPANPSSSDAAKLVNDKNLMQGNGLPAVASKVSAPAREQSQTQPASDRQTPLKRKRLVKAGEVVKKRAAEVSAAVPASTEAKPLVRSAAVGGLALVPLPPKLQEKVQTEEELDEDAPYWQEPPWPRSAGQFGTASSGHFRPGPTLSNAAKLLRAGHFAPSQPRPISNSPGHPLSTPIHVAGPDSSPSQTAAADAIPGPQSGYGMSTSSLPALPSEPDQDLPVPGQVAQHSWGMHEHPETRPSESAQKAWMPLLPHPELRNLQSQGSFTGPRDGPQKPPQDPRKQLTNTSHAPQARHLQNAQGSSEQPPPDQDTLAQQPFGLQSQAHVLEHVSEQPHDVQGHVQEQRCHQQGTSRPQSQHLQGSSRHSFCHRSHSPTSESPSQAVSFGVKRPLPVPVEPETIRMLLGYKWGKGNPVQGSIELEALCWSTDTVGKTWDAAGKPLLHCHNLHNCMNT